MKEINEYFDSLIEPPLSIPTEDGENLSKEDFDEAIERTRLADNYNTYFRVLSQMYGG